MTTITQKIPSNEYIEGFAPILKEIVTIGRLSKGLREALVIIEGGQKICSAEEKERLMRLLNCKNQDELNTQTEKLNTALVKADKAFKDANTKLEEYEEAYRVSMGMGEQQFHREVKGFGRKLLFGMLYVGKSIEEAAEIFVKDLTQERKE